MNPEIQTPFPIDEEIKRFMEADKVRLELAAQPLRDIFAVLKDTAYGNLDNCGIPWDLPAAVELLINLLQKNVNQVLMLNQITTIRPVSDNQLQILITI